MEALNRIRLQIEVLQSIVRISFHHRLKLGNVVIRCAEEDRVSLECVKDIPRSLINGPCAANRQLILEGPIRH